VSAEADATDLAGWIASCRARIDDALDRLLPRPDGPAARLGAAMRHAVLSGGKRLRPALALAAHEGCGGTGDGIVEPAAALELVHAYSLVHDDLPAMDDDDVRRGRPTVHRAFDEATAILAGDALLTLAFEVLASRPDDAGAASRRADAVAVVARAAGASGMVGGQIADLEGEGRPVEPEGLEWIHRHKTGALFAASAELGGVHAGASAAARRALATYGEKLGLAFQVADDVLDCTGSAVELGKTPGKDRAAGKATYPALLGLDASRSLAARLAEEAVGALRPHGLATDRLCALARLAATRDR
jgi:geranylgeranyl pyrophosphate synthase